MCFICEDTDRQEDFHYDHAIIRYDHDKQTTYQYAIKHYEETDEYMLYVRSDDDADMQILPIQYCPFCGFHLY